MTAGRSRSITTGIAIGLLGATMAWLLSERVPAHLFESKSLFDAYFGSDLPRSYSHMIDRHTTYQWGATKHPLFSLFLLPLTAACRLLFGVSDLDSTRILLSVNAFAWSLLVFLLCKSVTGRLLDSFLLTLLGLSSASAVFWLSVPETYAFGSTTMMMTLLVLLLSPLGRSYAANVLMQVVSLSMTITNWMVGIISSAIVFRSRKVLPITLHAVAIACLLASFQTLVVPKSGGFLFLRSMLTDGAIYSNRLPLSERLQHFFLTPLSPLRIKQLVIPKQETTRRPRHHVPRVDVTEFPRWQARVPTTVEPHFFDGVSKTIPWCLWGLLLMAGISSCLLAIGESHLIQATLLCLAAQFVLHFSYGNETFIYSLHWFPLFLFSIGAALRTRFRYLGLLLIGALVLHNVAVNLLMFRDVSEILTAFRRFA